MWTNLTGPLAGLVAPLMRRAMKIPEEGAATAVYLGTAPKVEGISGNYFVDNKAKYSSRASQDPEAARRLWRISEELTGQAYGHRSRSWV